MELYTVIRTWLNPDSPASEIHDATKSLVALADELHAKRLDAQLRSNEHVLNAIPAIGAPLTADELKQLQATLEVMANSVVVDVNLSGTPDVESLPAPVAEPQPDSAVEAPAPVKEPVAHKAPAKPHAKKKH